MLANLPEIAEVNGFCNWVSNHFASQFVSNKKKLSIKLKESSVELLTDGLLKQIFL